MNHATEQQLIDFEKGTVAAFNRGELPFLVHLSGGNEKQLIEIFADISEGDWVLSSHRNHYHCLLAGGKADKLAHLIANGKSMFVFDKERRFLSSAILGGMAGIGAGIALNLKQTDSPAKVWVFLGDGAEDEGAVCEAIRFVTARDLPCTFIIEDNNRQVDTSYAERWGNGTRFDWGPKVRRYYYTPTYPHAGRGDGPKVEFNKEIVTRCVQQF